MRVGAAAFRLLSVRIAVPDPPLSGDGILLRRLAADDLPWITAACADRELSRYIPSIPYPYSLADAEIFAEQAARGWEAGTSASFVITRADGGAGLGMIALAFAPGDPGMAEVGYWLGREARGRGVATSAVLLMSAWAFVELGIERLSLTTAPENQASQRVARRVGFTLEGRLRAWQPTGDGRRDSLMFSLLPGEAAEQADQASGLAD